MWLQLTRMLGACLFVALIASAQAQELKLDRDAVIRAKAYEADLIDASVKYGIDSRLLWAIAYLETRFNHKLVSRKGARGLMQLMPSTAARFGVTDPHNPKRAIDAAARYARYLMNRFNGRFDLTLAAYNAGEGAVEAFLAGRSIRDGKRVINPARLITGGVPPYRETRRYVEAGLSILAKIESSPEFGLGRRQVKKEITEKKNSSRHVPKSRSITYVGTTEQTESSQARSTFRLSISRDNR
jgi:soluble lytic murein transglycosylase-like protein